MSSSSPSPDAIRAESARRSAETEAYAPILSFYSEIFVAQEQSKSEVTLEPIDIPEDLLRLKTREQFPLISVSDFRLDTAAGEKLLADICGLAQSLGGAIAPAAEALMAAIDTERIDHRSLFFAVIEKDGFDLGELARIAGVSVEPLAFLAYHSVRPSLVRCAEALASRLDPDRWERGVCPVCGSPPVLSALREEGARHLVCSFCWHEWRSPRLFCPYCETKQSGSLHHFFDEAHPGCRVDLCDNCKKYIKTTDLRERTGLYYPPLEQVSTLHLDIRAKEMGYAGGASPALQS